MRFELWGGGGGAVAPIFHAERNMMVLSDGTSVSDIALVATFLLDNKPFEIPIAANNKYYSGAVIVYSIFIRF